MGRGVNERREERKRSFLARLPTNSKTAVTSRLILVWAQTSSAKEGKSDRGEEQAGIC